MSSSERNSKRRGPWDGAERRRDDGKRRDAVFVRAFVERLNRGPYAPASREKERPSPSCAEGGHGCQWGRQPVRKRAAARAWRRSGRERFPGTVPDGMAE